MDTTKKLSEYIDENSESDHLATYTNSRDLSNKYYTIIGQVTEPDKYRDGVTNHFFIIKDDMNNDTLYLDYFRKPSFIFVPYFLKYKQLFDGKTLIASTTKYYDNYKKLYPVFAQDLITDQYYEIVDGSKWTCKVAVLESCNNDIYFVLKNGDKTIAIKSMEQDGERIYQNKGPEPLGREGFFVTTSRSMSCCVSCWDCGISFILENAYYKRILKSQKEKEAMIALENSEKRKQKLEKQKYLNECITKYGDEQGRLIAEGKIRIGMTTEMCRTAWGDPYNTNKTTDASGTYEIWWYYGMQRFLSFSNGVLVKINE